MKNKHKYLLGSMMTLGVVALAACGNSSPKTSHVTTQQPQKDELQLQNDEANTDSNINSNNDSNNNREDTQIPSSAVNPENTEKVKENSYKTEEKNPPKQDISNNETTLKQPEKTLKDDVLGLKEEYLNELNKNKLEMDAKRKELENQSTYALKNLEGDRYNILDKLLNDIYGTLKQQLPDNKMEQLRKEQREWITLRENKAEEASRKYKGGTEELLEYVTVKNNLTEERCFELVNNYIK